MALLDVKVGDSVECLCWRDELSETVVSKIVDISHDYKDRILIMWGSLRWWVSRDNAYVKPTGTFNWFGRVNKILPTVQVDTRGHDKHTKKDFYMDRKAEAMKGVNPLTGETIVSETRGGGMKFL